MALCYSSPNWLRQPNHSNRCCKLSPTKYPIPLTTQLTWKLEGNIPEANQNHSAKLYKWAPSPFSVVVPKLEWHNFKALCVYAVFSFTTRRRQSIVGSQHINRNRAEWWRRYRTERQTKKKKKKKYTHTHIYLDRGTWQATVHGVAKSQQE